MRHFTLYSYPSKRITSAWLLLILITSTLVSSCKTTSQTDSSSTQGLVADKAMVVSAHPEASRIGIEILKKGGNAFDAAVATQFALAVALPVAGNIGGGGFLVYRDKDGQVGSLDYREKAPALSSERMYQDTEGNVIPELSTATHLASGVPGTVDGMYAVHQKFGSLPWADLVQPAIDLAENGVILTAREAAGLNSSKEAFTKNNKHLPYLIKDSAWEAGDTLYHKDLAKSLARIRDKGREGFYAGQTEILS